MKSVSEKESVHGNTVSGKKLSTNLEIKLLIISMRKKCLSLQTTEILLNSNESVKY